MRISLIGPVYPYRGGIAHHTTLLARALAVKHDVQVISFKRQYPKWLYPGKSDKDPSHSFIEVESIFVLDPLNPITWIHTICEIENHQPEKIVIPWWTTFFGPAFTFINIYFRFKKIPVIFIIHNVLPHEHSTFDKFIVKKYLKFGNGFVIQSENERHKLIEILPNAEITLCPHPIYQFTEKTNATVKDSRKSLNLPQESIVLLFFGMVRPYKGLKHLIEALCIPPLLAYKPYLLVAGEIWKHKSEYLQIIDKLGLSERVVLEDRYIPNEEIPTYFTASDVLVVPYIEGTQSGVIKLGIGYHIPIVASDFLLSEHEKAIFNSKVITTPAGDSESLANAIVQSVVENKTIKWCEDRNEEPDMGWEIFIETIAKFEPNQTYRIYADKSQKRSL